MHRCSRTRRRPARDGSQRGHRLPGQRHRAGDRHRHAPVRVGQNLRQPALRRLRPLLRHPEDYEPLRQGGTAAG